MIPAPGELFSDWCTNTGYREGGYEDVFYHDIAAELAAAARRRVREENSRGAAPAVAAADVAGGPDEVLAVP